MIVFSLFFELAFAERARSRAPLVLDTEPLDCADGGGLEMDIGWMDIGWMVDMSMLSKVSKGRLLLEVSILRIERTGLPRNQQQQSARMMEVRRTPTETTTTSTMCSAIMPSTASMVD